MNINLNPLQNNESNNSQQSKNSPKKQIMKKVSYKGPLGSNRISFPVLSVEDFERRFQFNNVVRNYNQLLGNKKRYTNNIYGINTTKGAFFPLIQEIEIKKHGMNDNDFIAGDDNEESTENKNKEVKDVNNKYNFSQKKELDSYNKYDLNEKIMKSKYYKTNSTLSQSNIFNKSNQKSYMTLDNINERKKILMRNLSNDSLFGPHRARYLLAKHDLKYKRKLALSEYKKQLEKIKKERMPLSKNAKLFQVYEIKFNTAKTKELLKNEFHFFKQEVNRKMPNIIDNRLQRLFQKLKENDEKKGNSSYFDIKHNYLKPSQRTIKNMIRKEEKFNLVKNSLLDFEK